MRMSIGDNINFDISFCGSNMNILHIYKYIDKIYKNWDKTAKVFFSNIKQLILIKYI